MKLSIIFLLSITAFTAFALPTQETSQEKVNLLVKFVDSLEYHEARKIDSMYVMNEQTPRSGSSVLLDINEEATKLIDAYLNENFDVVYVYDGIYTKEFWPEEMYDDEQPGSYYFKCQGEIHFTVNASQVNIVWGKTKNGQSKERCHPGH